MSFFGRPDDYSKMLNRMAIITGFLTIFCAVSIVGALAKRGIQLPIPTELASITFSGFGFTGPFYVLCTALFVAWVFRRFRLHDRISNLYKIRESFDLHVILVRLAGEVEITVDLQRLKILRNKRIQLMNDVFYKYVDAHNPKISKHHVAEALDAWYGYWISIEAAVLFIITALVLMFLQSFGASSVFLLLSLLLILKSLKYFEKCAPLAEKEIGAITKHDKWPTWKNDIKNRFNDALSN